MQEISFGSDNHSAVHPLVMAALSEVNQGFCFGYGDDPYTEEVIALLRDSFGGNCDIWMVMTGTGANVISLQALLHSFNAVLCPHTSHINVDECGAVQKFTQARLLPINTPDGKLSPELIEPALGGRGDQHHSQKKIVSISQSTEYGTAYSLDELSALAEYVHSKGLLLHIDGARLANAAAYLGVSLKAMTSEVGADVVSFGGTKNGMMFGEAIISFVPELTQNILYFRKQASQLYSKARFIAAQYKAYLQDELWRSCALHANRMASLLAQELDQFPQVRVTQKVQANAVFVILPPEWIKALQPRYMFYMWDEVIHEARLMCSFTTREEHISTLIRDIRTLSECRENGIIQNLQ
ncbi:MAG: beta-eliminating lyase-related protein [Candidatus Cloacimonetes bacterium]|nr:beta-eliminating lyase-related protein [Candidatus Cloacimonadota bacterium]